MLKGFLALFEFKDQIYLSEIVQLLPGLELSSYRAHYLLNPLHHRMIEICYH